MERTVNGEDPSGGSHLFRICCTKNCLNDYDLSSGKVSLSEAKGNRGASTENKESSNFESPLMAQASVPTQVIRV